jgi:NAD(P)H-nitrite reductase large subunit
LDQTEDLRKAREQAIIDGFKPICLCNKIRKAVIVKAIQGGANTVDMVKRRTGAGTGPCGGQRCGPMVRGMLGEEVETCLDCGWSIIKGPPPLTCPRCGAVQRRD